MKDNKEFFFFCLVLLLLCFTSFGVSAQVRVTEESKDYAYDAPESELIGIWQFLDSEHKCVFNNDGTLDRYILKKGHGVRFWLITHYTWKKKNNEIWYRQIPRYEGTSCIIDPRDQDVFDNLSNRKKDELKKFMDEDKREHRREYTGGQCLILVLITKNNMVFQEKDYESQEIINNILERVKSIY